MHSGHSGCAFDAPRFALGAHCARELWLAFGAISPNILHCGSALDGPGGAFGTHSATELWFTVGAISATTTTLVQTPT